LIKQFFIVIAVVLLGAASSLLFSVWLFPFMLTSPYFANFKFVKDFKEGRIVVNTTQQVYIQQNVALQSSLERVKQSIVTIQSGNKLSSGLVATSDGSVVTLAGSVPTSGTFSVFFQGQKATFSVITVDRPSNLALLKMDKNGLQTVGFAPADSVKLGQRVFLTAPTNTQQDNWFANEGIIREIDSGLIKTSILEKSIANGSPLFNSSGELVGLAFVDAQGGISAIPVSSIQQVLGL
jgi:S1-C subfamily serine protease